MSEYMLLTEMTGEMGIASTYLNKLLRTEIKHERFPEVVKRKGGYQYYRRADFLAWLKVSGYKRKGLDTDLVAMFLRNKPEGVSHEHC